MWVGIYEKHVDRTAGDDALRESSRDELMGMNVDVSIYPLAIN